MSMGARSWICPSFRNAVGSGSATTWLTISLITAYIFATVPSSTWDAGVDLSMPTRLQTSSAYCPPRLTEVARVLTQSESEALNDLRKSSSEESVGSNLVFGIR